MCDLGPHYNKKEKKILRSLSLPGSQGPNGGEITLRDQEQAHKGKTRAQPILPIYKLHYINILMAFAH